MIKYKALIISFLTIFFMLIMSTYLMLSSNQKVIVIGTKNMTEQKIIANILKNVIEDQTNYKVEILPGIGETSFLQGAILKGDIDLYVDYTSTAYESVLGHKYDGESSEKIYNIVNDEYQEKYNLEWTSLLGFDNTNAILCSDYCKNKKITKLSQLKNKKNLTIAAPIQFFSRSDGLKLLEKKYKIKISAQNQIPLDHSMIYEAIQNNQVDLALGYTTDGQLYNSDITVLEDDLNAFPKYDAGIVVSKKTLKKYPELSIILNKMNDLISLEDMQKMNYQKDVKGGNVDAISYYFTQSL